MHDADWGGGHFSAVMGGMWGLKLPINFNMAEKINLFTSDKVGFNSIVNDLIIVSNETLSLKKFNLLLDKYKEFIILLRKTLDEC